MPQVADFTGKTYLAVVQCHIVMERCPGYLCERSFTQRTGGFEKLTKEQTCRIIYLTCGGCCGKAIHRKLAWLAQQAQKKDQIPRAQILVKFASCITKDNYHGPPCPHLDYLVQLVDKLGLDYSFDTAISQKSEQLRAQGRYTASA